MLYKGQSYNFKNFRVNKQHLALPLLECILDESTIMQNMNYIHNLLCAIPKTTMTYHGYYRFLYLAKIIFVCDKLFNGNDVLFPLIIKNTAEILLNSTESLLVVRGKIPNFSETISTTLTEILMSLTKLMINRIKDIVNIPTSYWIYFEYFLRFISICSTRVTNLKYIINTESSSFVHILISLLLYKVKYFSYVQDINYSLYNTKELISHGGHAALVTGRKMKIQ